MGRKRTTYHGLPPRMHIKGRAFYHVSTGKPRVWTSLGTDKGKALREWAKLEAEPVDPKTCTFRAVGARYMREIVPNKARQTQKDNDKEFCNLDKVFGEVAIDAIEPHHVRRYLDERGKSARIRANREKALLSAIFNAAREWGYTSKANPCQGVKGFKETGRDRYVEDSEFQAVWDQAHFTVQDAMDVALLTSQRPSDVIKMRRADIRGGALEVTQNKTGKKLRIAVEGELAKVLERILLRPRQISSLYLIQDEQGQPLSYTTLRSRFDKARTLAGVNFQFRDIRAKAATDVDNLAHAQKLLGHKTRQMTEHYTRNRRGESVKPLK